MKKVLIYHTNPPEESSVSAEEIYGQAEFVAQGLRDGGYNAKMLPFISHGKKDKETLERIQEEIFGFDVVFNLVESVAGTDRLGYLAPEIFQGIGIPYTGCPYSALKKVQTKIGAKLLMHDAEIPTPDFAMSGLLHAMDISGRDFLIKHRQDNASKGLKAKTYKTKEEIRTALEEAGENDFFAEEFIDGREFNVSMIGPSGNCKVLPIPEMTFVNWPKDMPKIVSEDAKFNPNSKEYQRTVRDFDLSDSDKQILTRLEKISRRCWRVFDLKGYARVDFRVDKTGNPYVLEINPNPGISEDSGFVAATKKAGMTWKKTLERIVNYSFE